MIIEDSKQPIPLEGQPTRTYAFTPWSVNGSRDGMDLVPQAEKPDEDDAPYRITSELDLNPFLPVSYTTRILRYGTDTRQGASVGEFSISLNNKRAVLRMGDLSTRLSSVLYNVNSSPKHFNWILTNKLHWDCRTSLPNGSPICICYLASPAQSANVPENDLGRLTSMQIATFIPPPLDASPPLPDATLTVFPAGRDLMDEIVVSALVVERMLVR